MSHRPSTCAVVLTDDVATRHRLKQVEKVAKRSEYLTISFTMLQSMSGTLFRLSKLNARCNVLALIDADALKVPTNWSSLTAFRSSEDAAGFALKCNRTVGDDILIYNRLGTRKSSTTKKWLMTRWRVLG